MFNEKKCDACSNQGYAYIRIQTDDNNETDALRLCKEHFQKMCESFLNEIMNLVRLENCNLSRLVIGGIKHV